MNHILKWSLGEGCTFGPGCTYGCHCEGGQPCDPNTGDCPNGCDDGVLSGPYGYRGAWSGYGCQIGEFKHKLDWKQYMRWRNGMGDMDSHYKDKTMYRPSNFYNGNLHTWKGCLNIETRPCSLIIFIFGDYAIASCYCTRIRCVIVWWAWTLLTWYAISQYHNMYLIPPWGRYPRSYIGYSVSVGYSLGR